MSTYEATQAEQAGEVADLRAALAAVQAENLTLQVLLAASARIAVSAAHGRRPCRPIKRIEQQITAVQGQR